MTQQLRMAVVGLGMMGRHHVRVLSARPDVELVAVVDPLGDPYGAAAGIDHYNSVDGAIASGIHAAVVATPTDDHVTVGERLVAAGISVLVEKPLAADSASGRRLSAAVADAGVIGAVGHIERFNPAIRSLKQRIAEGELGEIFQIATSRQGPYPERVRDVGVIKDLATHDIDMVTFISGERYRDIAANVAHRAGSEHEDLVSITASLTDGTVVTHLVNWVTPTKERRVVVTGSRGCFVANTLTADLTFFANSSVPTTWDDMSRFRGVSEGDMIRYAIQKPEPLAVEIEGFVTAVRRLAEGDDALGAEIVSMEEGLATLEVAEAASEAARLRTIVELGGAGR